MFKIPFLGKNEESEEDYDITKEYVDLNVDEDLVAKMNVIIEKIEGIYGVDRIMRNVRDGHIVLVNISDLKITNIEELKHSISRMKTSIQNIKGDIAGAGEEWIILTPRDIGIRRDSQKASE